MAKLTAQINADASQFLDVIKEVLKIAQELGDKIQESVQGVGFDIDTSQLEEAVASFDELQGQSIDTDVEVDSSQIGEAGGEIDGLNGTTIDTSVDVDKSQVESLPDDFEQAGLEAGNKFKKGFSGLNIGALAGAGAVAGLGVLAVKAGETADRLLDLNNITDISTDTLQEYQYVSNQAGVSAEALSTSATKLTQKLGTMNGETDPVSKSFEALGISVRDGLGNLKTGEQLMEESLPLLADMENQTERNAISAQLFGGSYKDLAPILGMGSEKIKELREEANKLGLVKTNQDLVDANAFRQQVDQMKAIAGSIAFDIGKAVQPLLGVLIPVIKDLVGIITTILKPVIDALTPVLGDIFDAVGELAGVLGTLLADVLGEIGTLLAPLGELLVPIIQAVSKVMKELSPIITEVVTIVVELVNSLLTALEPVLGVILDLFVDLVKVALKPLLPLLQAIAPLIQALAPIIQLVATLIAPLIELIGMFAVQLVELINIGLEPVIDFIAILSKEIKAFVDGVAGFILDIGEAIGLIDKKKPKLEIETNTKEVTKDVEDLNKLEVDKKPISLEPNPSTKTVKKELADLSNFAKDLFEKNPITIDINTEFKLSTLGIDDALKFFSGEVALTGDTDILNEIDKELEKIQSKKADLVNTEQFIQLQIDGTDKVISDLSSVRNETDKVLKSLEGKKLDLINLASVETDPEVRTKLLKQVEELNNDIIEQTIKTSTKSNLTREQLTQISNKKLEKLTKDNTDKLNDDLLKSELKLLGLKEEFAGASARDIQKLELDLADDSLEVQKQREIFATQDKYAKLLNEFRFDENAKLKIRESFNKELEAIDRKYTVTTIDLYEDLAEKIGASFSSFDATKFINTNKDIEKSIDGVKKKYTEDTEALKKELDNKKISYQEYNEKVLELETAKNEKLKQLEADRVGFIDILNSQLSESLGKLAVEYQDAFKIKVTAVLELNDKLKDLQEQYEAGAITEQEYAEQTTQAQLSKEDALQKSYETIGVASGLMLGQMLADGESFTTALAQTALAGLQQLVPIFIAEIFGSTIGQLGPIAGPITAGVLTAALQALVGTAQASIGGANDGVIGLNESNKGKPRGADSILMMLAPNESVITAQGTAKNKPYLEFINKGGNIADLITPNVYINPKHTNSNDMSETNKRLDETNRRLDVLSSKFGSMKVNHFHDKQPMVNVNNTIEIKSQRGRL